MINNMIRFGCSACSINPYGCNACSYFSTFGTSKARWCCGGDPGAEYDRYASLYAADTLTAAAGGSIPFTTSALTGSFSYNADNLLVILQAGVYQATYTVNIPSGAAVDTTFTLQLGGKVLPGSQVSVVHTNDDGSVTVTGQALFSAGYTSLLSLVTSNALTLTGANAGDVLASLIVTTL